MKTLNRLIISMLLTMGTVLSANAADLDHQIAEMNRVLQQQIDQRMAEDLQLAIKARVQVFELSNNKSVAGKSAEPATGTAS